MSDDRSAAAGMEELQNTRQKMKDLKTQVNTAEDRSEEVAKKAGVEAVRGTVKTAHTHTSHQAKVLAPRFTKGMTLVSHKSQVSALHKMKVVPEAESLPRYMELPAEDAGLEPHTENGDDIDNLAKADCVEELYIKLDGSGDREEANLHSRVLRNYSMGGGHIRTRDVF